MTYVLHVTEHDGTMTEQTLNKIDSRERALIAFDLIWPRANVKKVQHIEMFEDDLRIAFVRVSPFKESA